MKKIVLLAVVISAASFTSCKKAYTCECTLTQTGVTANGTPVSGTTYSEVSTKNISKTSKKGAQAQCGNATGTHSETNSGTAYVMNFTRTCTLK